MELGMIGLGRMGANMTERLVKGGHRVVGFDPKPEARAQARRQGRRIGGLARYARCQLEGATHTLDDGSGRQHHRRHRDCTACRCLRQAMCLSTAAIPTTRTRCAVQTPPPSKKIDYVDCGTSGGVWGLAEGYSMMVGGDEAVVARLKPIFETLAPAPNRGWGRVGPVGSGHFHQNDSQRHRIRTDAGLCRRLFHSAAQARVRPRPASNRRDLALRQRSALVAAGSHGGCAGKEPDDGRHRTLMLPIPAKVAGR